MEVPNSMMTKLREDDEQTLTELNSAHGHSSPFASKMSVSTNQLH